MTHQEIANGLDLIGNNQDSPTIQISLQLVREFILSGNEEVMYACLANLFCNIDESRSEEIKAFMENYQEIEDRLHNALRNRKNRRGGKNG